MATKSKYKAVIFDYDDTLVETRAIKWAHHRAVAKEFYHIDLSDEVLLKHWGKPLYVLIAELYQYSDTLENMIKANLSIRDKFLKKVYTGSVKAITELVDRGVKVGILSATTNEFLLDDLIRHGFPVSNFSIIQGSDKTMVHKPDPKVFIPLLKKFKKEGIKKEEIIYVGDSLDDLQAAHGAGIGFIAVTTGLYSKEDFKKNGAKVIIKDIKELTSKIL